MEGRLSRENITRQASQPERAGNDPARIRYNKRPSGSARSRYRRHGYGSRRKGLYEGGNLFPAQLYASGVLLLVVLFSALFSSEPTIFVREGLSSLLSKNITFGELFEGADSVKNALTGRTGSVFEIFGGELNNLQAETDGDAAETAGGEYGSITGEDVFIDSGSLRDIYENTQDYSKN